MSNFIERLYDSDEPAIRYNWLLGTSVQKYAPLREKNLLTLLANRGGFV
jgi:hypothetical protein